MRNNDTISKTLLVAILLCLFCSAIISYTAVSLKDLQEANVRLDKQKKILASANLLDENKTVEELFGSIESKIINLDTGRYDSSINLSSFSERAYARDVNTSTVLSVDQDIATIKRRENYQKVYLHYQNGKISAVILPVRGYGLWGTLYGFLALESDFKTIIGLEFYQHKETAGLGAEVDNPRWKALWEGKKISSETGEILISVIKGSVDKTSPKAQYQVDGLSGATITGRGVSNLLSFWLGDLGYGPYMKEMLSKDEDADV